jgi:hypothetical protein
MCAPQRFTAVKKSRLNDGFDMRANLETISGIVCLHHHSFR